MGNESGEWIMHGMKWNNPECIHSVDEAIEYINKVGFLPLFKNDIDGFSLEERTVPEYWWSDDPEIYSNELKKQAGFGKDGEKGFDGAITNLMMQTYLCNCDFKKRVNKRGIEYGWDVAVYSSIEHIYGYDYVTSCYKDNPQDSWKQLVDYMRKMYPDATDKQIRKVLK